MTLQSKLDAFKLAFENDKPTYASAPSAIEIMKRACAELVASGQARRALKAGDMAPVFELYDIDGASVSSSELLARGPLVVSFYRGVWCPYCNMELEALQAALPAYRDAGAELVAISPQTRVNSRRSARRNGLGFPILSDEQGKTAAAFGIRYELPHYLVELHQSLGNDLPKTNADPSRTLPMPARYVIDPSGMIRYAEISPDHTRRSEPEELLTAIRASALKA